MSLAAANSGLRRAVLVGVGTAAQHEPPGEGVGALDLMVRAAGAAADDTGSPEILRAVERILVPHGTWRARDAGRTIARAVGAVAARSVLVEIGIPQQALIDQALAAIASGEIDVALVVGGEAKRRDDLARRAGIALAPPDDPGTDPDERQVPDAEIVSPAEIATGFVVPVQQYAAIDNALRAAEGQSIAEHCRDIDSLWSRFDAVAITNPEAAFAAGRTPAALRDPGGGNRPLGFPYNKWHATQWAVDQAGALLLCSETAADRFGIAPALRVHPWVSLESSHSLTLSRRAWLHRWPAMAELGRAAEAHLGRALPDLDLVELYSCFPAAVRVQQRELGLPLDGTPTLTGGMPFAGGPFNHFVFQATATMIRRLRDAPGAVGLVTTVSGLLTKPGLAVWSTDAGDRAPLLADLAASAAAATPERDVVEGYVGAATVATYTVRHDREGPAQIVAIADTPEGDRVVAVVDDRDAAAAATHRELIGAEITVDGPTAAMR